jgi:ribosomal protein S18 acetylase RimI-like enzyme
LNAEPANTGDVTIRPAAGDDTEALIGLIHQYLDFYRVAYPDETLLRSLIERLQSDPSRGAQLIALQDGNLVGFASLYATLDTFLAREILIMNDLFVSPAGRSAGVGTLLFQACRRYAAEKGYARVDWVTAPDNLAAQRFYDRHGGRRGPWLAYSIAPSTGDA